MATPERLGEILGEIPAPRGSWRHEAVYASAAALRAPERGAELAARLRAVPGVRDVRTAPGGMLLITVDRPGEVVREIAAGGAALPAAPAEPAPDAGPGRAGGRWPDLPRNWDNPGFVVRYAHVRAAAVQRWAARLGVPEAGFDPDALSAPPDRAAVRVLAEWPSRRRRPGLDHGPYLERLALAYHDAHERAPALPRGDEPVGAVHVARVWLARAVRAVLAAGLAALGETPPARI
ncbi:MAG: DALR anticodon-binding domain-containing protein [Actinomycetes bacterium]